MAATQIEEQVSLKLLLNKKTNKVILAEAGKDFVDVLFSFLTMPLGTIARLVQRSDMGPVGVGCLSSLYGSVTNLCECLLTVTCKEMLLWPRNTSEEYCRSLKLNIDDTEPSKHFLCMNFPKCSHDLLSTFKNERCNCGNLLSRSVSVKSDKVYDGFVNDVATFIVTDDLVVIPNGMDTSFSVLQKCGVKSLSSVQEMTVNVTKKKVLDLLKCSLLSKSTLTDLFLVKKPLFNKSSFSPFIVENSSTIQIKVKLIIRKSDGKVLFAEGEEDFVDFLFSFLTFPLGGVVRMLGGYSSIGSVDGLYNSIVGLNENKYLIAKEVKNRLVDPGLAPQFKLSMQMFPINEQASQYYCYYPRRYTESIHYNQFFIANGNRSYDKNIVTSKVLKFVDLKSSGGSLKGYAKGPAMFVATDDLVVERMSPTSGVSLLNRLKTPLNDVEEKVVTIGIKEGLNILKASLTSRSALTNGLSHLLLLPEVMEQKWYC
ncbi:tyrosine/DOPA decarboxylase [Spatholobus suberectus]|nr:tyrosine/DOPA decarboxylase [Spatholobus suberectus]